MNINGVNMITITGCDNCPIYDFDKNICKLIKGDAKDCPTEEYGSGQRVKVKCPLFNCNFIVINFADTSDKPTFVGRLN